MNTTPHEQRGELVRTELGSPPEVRHIEILKTEILDLDRQPQRDYVAMATQYTGIGTASVMAARELPALGVVLTLVSIGILASKGVSAYYGDKAKIPEIIMISTVILATATLGFADKFNRRSPTPNPNHVHQQQLN
jgi:hypothetical protein